MNRFKNILLVVQSELDDDPAIDFAFNLAHRNEAQLKIFGCHQALPDYLRTLGPGDMIRSAENKALSEFKHSLEQLVQLRGEGLNTELSTRSGRSSLEIVREVVRANHDLVIKTVNTTNWFETAFFGTTDNRLLRNCPCAVWLIENSKHTEIKRVVAAIDAVSEVPEEIELNRKVVKLASSLADTFSAKGHLLYCYGQTDSMILERTLDHEDYLHYLISFQTSASKKLRSILLEQQVDPSMLQPQALKGDPEYVIPKFMKEERNSLLVMGTVARTGIPGFVIGNTAERILSQVSCGVLALKPDTFLTPVELS